MKVGRGPGPLGSLVGWKADGCSRATVMGVKGGVVLFLVIQGWFNFETV